MTMSITKALNNKDLSLNAKKKAAHIDFMSTLPELTTTATLRRNILNGFYESGLVIQTKSRYPVLNINLNKKKIVALLDFISILPDLSTKVTSYGYHETGLINQTKLRHPML